MRPTSLISGTFAVLAVVLVAAVPATAAGPQLSRTERAILRKVDRQRAGHGLHAVRSSRALARAADAHSREMLSANYFAHSSRNGGSFATRIHRFAHARKVGETLAMLSRCGRHSARWVVSMWMHSPVHRAVLLTGGFHRVGIALRRGRLGGRRACMVTADFAN
jgi:uncharacterized protein YkwD